MDSIKSNLQKSFLHLSKKSKIIPILFVLIICLFTLGFTVISVSGSGTIKTKKLDVPYIHQRYDTPIDFVGAFACAPASAVMILAYHKRIEPDPITLYEPSKHTSPYGKYISKSYTYGDYTFSKKHVKRDVCNKIASGRGAWGYIWQDSSQNCEGCGVKPNLIKYLERHDLKVSFINTPTKERAKEIVKREINNGRPLIARNYLTDSGHYVVIVGYKIDSNGNFWYLVNDPNGNQTYYKKPGNKCWGCYVEGDPERNNPKCPQPVKYSYEEMGLGSSSRGLFTIESEKNVNIHAKSDKKIKFPDKIKVFLTDENKVVEVDFKEYCKSVLPNEWYASWDMDALKVGAMTVKMYGWYRKKVDKYPDKNYDVKDTAVDQIYNPRNKHLRSNKAVEETWNYVMMRNGKIFESQYDAGYRGKIKPQNSGRLSQRGSKYLAVERNLNWKEILNFYYNPVEISKLNTKSKKKSKAKQVVETPQKICGKCGGIFDLCHETECELLGNCWFKKKFFGLMNNCWSCDEGKHKIEKCEDYSSKKLCEKDYCNVGDCVSTKGKNNKNICIDKKNIIEDKKVRKKLSKIHIAFHPSCEDGREITYQVANDLKRNMNFLVKEFVTRDESECEFKKDSRVPKNFPFWPYKPEKNYLIISLKNYGSRIKYLDEAELYTSSYGKELASSLTTELRKRGFTLKDPIPVICPGYLDLCGNFQGGTVVSIRLNFNKKNIDSIVKGIRKGMISFAKEDIRKNSNKAEKALSQYTNKQAFLISNKNWRKILSLVPVSVWTDSSGEIHKHPTLIYHEENGDIDIDSIVHFLQQYNPDSLKVVGNLPQKLENILATPSEVGAGLEEGEITELENTDYLEYWKNYQKIIYVENNYKEALTASAYASLVNSPLIIEGYNDKINLENKKIICVGDVNKNCNEKYTINELQKKYLQKTNTNKIIITNPNDLNLKVLGKIKTEKTKDTIDKLYSKTSLAAPFLASAKQEIIFSTDSTGYKNINEFLETKISNLNIKAKYLTILAAPNAIQMSKKTKPQGNRVEVDNHIYGNLDNDIFQELAVGRIFSYTISDVSSYMMRDLFYSDLPKSKHFSVLWPGMPGQMYGDKVEGRSVEDTFIEMDYISNSYFSDEKNPPDPSEFKNKFLLAYLGHQKATGGSYNFNTIQLRRNNIWLKSPMILMSGCRSCAFELSKGDKSNLFCSNLLKRGAAFIYGASVDSTAANWDIVKMLSEEMLVSENIGNAVKSVRNKAVMWGKKWNQEVSENDIERQEEYDPWNVLIGDPTFKLNFEKPKLKEVSVSSNRIGDKHYLIEINIPRLRKIYTINYGDSEGNEYDVSLFNYPFGKEVGSFAKYSYKKYKPNGELLKKSYMDYGFLLFSLNIPEGYSISNVEDVKYIGEETRKNVEKMPVFNSGKGNFNYIVYEKDRGSNNKYYFIMDLEYGGNPPIVQTKNTIPSHRFEIQLELKEND